MSDSTDTTVTPTTDAIVEWPTAPNGDGSEQTDWDDASFGQFSEVFVTRLQAIAEDESLNEVTGPAAIEALITEANEATNIPVGVINSFVNQILNPDPIAQLLAQLGLDPSQVQVIGG